MKRIFLTGFMIAAGAMLFASSFSRDYYSSEEITAFKAELKYENIEIQSIDDDEIKIEISCNNAHKVPEISIDDGVLQIKSIKKFTYAENCTVYIYIPEAMKSEYIEVNTVSGEIKLLDLTSQAIAINSVSGDIDCVQVESEGDFIASTVSGDITLKSVEAEDFSLTAVSGDIDLKRVSGEQAEVKTTSGDIEAEDLVVGFIKCNSLSGSVELNKSDCDSFEIQTVSGSIEVELNGEPEDDSSIISTSGSVDLRLPKDSAFQLEVSSISGSFDDDFERRSYRPRGKIRSKYNGGGVNISIQTKSGSISLDD